MITLETDLYLLCSLFNVQSSKISREYSGFTVDEIMEAEAAQGNTKAANYSREILSDPVKLIELFQLNDVGNKYAILSHMTEQDLEDILPFLEEKDLTSGLNFFTKDKLVDMSSQLPKEELLKLTFEMFSPEHLMSLMPDEELNKVLSSPDIDKQMEIKFLKTMKPEILAQMFEAATGQSIMDVESQSQSNNGQSMEDLQANSQISMGMGGQVYGLNQASLINQISTLPDNKFQEAMLSIPTANKQAFVLRLAKQDPKIFTLFDSKAYTNIIDMKKDKEQIIKSTNVIKKESLVKMNEQLPQNLTAVVLTQLDTNVFADLLRTKFKSIMSQIIAA